MGFKQPDVTWDFCKTYVNHFQQRTLILKLIFSLLCFYLELFCNPSFGRRGTGCWDCIWRSWLFSPANSDLGKVSAQHLLCSENLHEQHSYGFIPCLMSTHCLTSLPIGRVPPHLSSGTCLLFWLLWEAICRLNKTSAALESGLWGLHAM